MLPWPAWCFSLLCSFAASERWAERNLEEQQTTVKDDRVLREFLQEVFFITIRFNSSTWKYLPEQKSKTKDIFLAAIYSAYVLSFSIDVFLDGILRIARFLK